MSGFWRLVDGVELSVSRRRYGNSTYTRVSARLNEGEPWNQWVDLGDPWPCVTPKLSEVRDALRWELGGRVLPDYTAKLP